MLTRALRTIGTAVVCASLAGTASAQITCGSTVTTKVKLTADMSCMTAWGFVIDGGAVDMGGHKLEMGPGSFGVLLGGKGSSLSNGYILAPGGVGVDLGGDGGHKVTNVVVRGATDCFRGNSAKNVLKNCVALEGTNSGITLSGASNSVIGSHVTGALGGIQISGLGSKLTENTVVDASFTGISASGDGQKLTRNHSVDSLECIAATGSKNTLVGNIAGPTSVTDPLNFVFDVGAAMTTKHTMTGNVAVGGSHGIRVTGDSSSLIKNVVHGNVRNGIVVVGDNNKLTSNSAHNNGQNGIRLDPNSDSNVLTSNRSSGNGIDGIVITSPGGTGNTISKSIALGNGSYDLDDTHTTCTGNVWKSNLFGTSIAGVTASDPCIE